MNRTPQTDRIIQNMIASITAAKSDWLSNQMQRFMPAEVYALAKTEKGSDRIKLARWMSKNKVSLREYQPSHSDWKKPFTGPEQNGLGDPAYSKSELLLDGKVISLFSFRLKAGKLEYMVKDFPIGENVAPS